MNESLAKQLHDLITNYKLTIAYEMSQELNNLEDDINKLIENKTHEEK